MDQQIDTKPLLDEQGRLIGYSCEGAENHANVHEVATSFYFGLQYPIGQQAAAVDYINQELLEDIAGGYHLISGTACTVLNQEGMTTIASLQDQPSSSLVSIQSNINRVELGQSCEDETSFDPNLQECHTSQLIVKGLVWNAVAMPDVISTIQNCLQGNGDQPWPLLASNNPYYQIHYLGGQELEDQMVISTGAGRGPTYPAYQQEGLEQDGTTHNKNYLTGLYEMSPLGKAVVCLLVFAFFGLILAFLRKQKLQRVRDEERRRAAGTDKENELPVPEIDGASSSSPPSSKSDFSMTRSISAGSA